MILLLTGESSEETALGSLLNRPDLEVAEQAQIQGTTNAAIQAVVRNSGDGAAYRTTIEFRLKQRDTVIETAHGVFGRVEPGQRV